MAVECACFGCEEPSLEQEDRAVRVRKRIADQTPRVLSPLERETLRLAAEFREAEAAYRKHPAPQSSECVQLLRASQHRLRVLVHHLTADLHEPSP